MKSKTTKRKIAQTVVGAAVGGAIAGPVGAIAGGLAAGHVEEGLEYASELKPPRLRSAARLAAEDPMAHAYPKRILVPLDFSPPSERAMHFAREWATLFGAEVFLLHVSEPGLVVRDFGVAPVGSIGHDFAARAKAALVILARKVFPSSIPVTTMVRKGKPDDEIAITAQEIHADLIIIATHGRSGLKRVLLGSTAEHVARHAPCPVLILRRRPKQRKSQSPSSDRNAG